MNRQSSVVLARAIPVDNEMNVMSALQQAPDQVVRRPLRAPRIRGKAVKKSWRGLRK